MLKAPTNLSLVFFPAFDWAISPSHPEREERLLYTKDQIREEGILDIAGIRSYNPSLATAEDIQRVHFCVPDVETRVPQSHLISAGGAIVAAEKVLSGEAERAFAIVRPPGHHAQRVVYGDRGFCIVNIEAVMIENVRRRFGHRRVAIIDTDCHHGDGTQDIYWNDPDTLYISFHQDGRTLYPGTGFPEEQGGPSASGYTINVPLPPQTGDEGFLTVTERLVLPVLEEFKPDLIINSAGQDNHYTDPLTNMRFTAQGYARLNELLQPDIAVLEGGYSIEGALPYVNLGIILAMAGLDYSHVREPDFDREALRQDAEISRYIERLCDGLLEMWRSREQRRPHGKGEYLEAQRRIYYDTDGIIENQNQRYYLCGNCPGVDTVTSSCDRGYRIFGVTVPRQACAACREKARKLFEGANRRSFTHLYLQDRAEDSFLSEVPGN